MKLKHTQTEWRISDQGENGVFISSGEGSQSGAVARVYSKNSLIETEEEAAANSLLVVSAPKGLQVAIKTYVKLLMKPTDSWRISNQSAYTDLREFIAEATGYSEKQVQEFYQQVAYYVKCNELSLDDAIKKQEKEFTV